MEDNVTAKDFYDYINADYNEAIARLGSDEIIMCILEEFLEDTTYQSLENAVEAGDIKNSFLYAHTLKGVASNLGFDGLNRASDELTEQLRPQQEVADKALFDEVKKEYELTVDGLKKLYQ